MTAFDALKTRLAPQLDAAPWLRWALLASALLAALLLVQGLESVRRDAEARATDTEAQLRRFRALQGQDAWLARQSAASQLHGSLLGQIPTAPSPGQAQARLQSWLGELASASGATDVRVTIDSTTRLAAPEGVVRLHATLRGGMPARSALNLVRRIEGGTALVVIDTAEIRDDTNKNAMLGLNAYYRIPLTQAAR